MLKKGKGPEVLPLWDLLPLLFSPLLSILFSLFSDGICIFYQPIFPKTKASFLLFNFILNYASQTLHAWNSGGDLFLSAETANQAPRLPHLPAQQCDSPTVWWWNFLDGQTWMTPDNQPCWICLPLLVSSLSALSVTGSRPFQPLTQQSVFWCALYSGLLHMSEGHFN